MTPEARRRAVPRAVVLSWVLSTLLGGSVVAATVAGSAAQPRTLSPTTLAGYLAEVAPARADDVRVNGVYGSGHSGAWQFVAHLTWRDEDVIRGGVTNLPALAGGAAVDSPVDESSLAAEHEIGWTLRQLNAVLSRLEGTDDALAMLELEITTTRDSFIACHSARRASTGYCTEHQRTGDVIRRFSAALSDEPSGDAHSVRRV